MKYLGEYHRDINYIGFESIPDKMRLYSYFSGKYNNSGTLYLVIPDLGVVKKHITHMKYFFFKQLTDITYPSFNKYEGYTFLISINGVTSLIHQTQPHDVRI